MYGFNQSSETISERVFIIIHAEIPIASLAPFVEWFQRKYEFWRLPKSIFLENFLIFQCHLPKTKMIRINVYAFIACIQPLSTLFYEAKQSKFGNCILVPAFCIVGSWA